MRDASVTFAPSCSVLPGEGGDGPVGALALRQVVPDGVEVTDGSLDAARHHHGPRLPADLVQAGHLLVEVVHHDLRLEADGVLVILHVAAQLLPGPLGVELRVSLHHLDEPIVAVHGRVVLQHVDDEAFLDRLLHGVDVEWEMPGVPALWRRVAEDFQGLVLGGGGEGEVAGVGQ